MRQPFRFRVKVRFDKDDALWYAECTDLQGCHTFGETKEAALENIYEVIQDRILAAADVARDALRAKAAKRGKSWFTRSSTETLEISVDA